MLFRKISLTACAVAMTVSLAGCGDSDSTASGNETTAPSSSATPSETPESSPEATGRVSAMELTAKMKEVGPDLSEENASCIGDALYASTITDQGLEEIIATPADAEEVKFSNPEDDAYVNGDNFYGIIVECVGGDDLDSTLEDKSAEASECIEDAHSYDGQNDESDEPDCLTIGGNNSFEADTESELE